MPSIPKTALLFPTRQRPRNVQRLIQSVLDTADDPYGIMVVMYIDDDDHSYDDLELPDPPHVIRLKGPRKFGGQVNLSVMWNKCYEAAKDFADYFMHCGDDIVFRSSGWDTKVKEAIDARPGKIAFVWGNDYQPDSQRNTFGTHGFIHKNWVNVTGRFVPPYFVSDYNDTYFNDVAEMLHVRQYLDDVITEHMHFSLGKAEIDQNTKDRLERHNSQQPERIYNSPWFKAEMEEGRRKLQEFINDHA